MNCATPCSPPACTCSQPFTETVPLFSRYSPFGPISKLPATSCVPASWSQRLKTPETSALPEDNQALESSNRPPFVTDTAPKRDAASSAKVASPCTERESAPTAE